MSLARGAISLVCPPPIRVILPVVGRPGARAQGSAPAGPQRHGGTALRLGKGAPCRELSDQCRESDIKFEPPPGIRDPPASSEFKPLAGTFASTSRTGR